MRHPLLTRSVSEVMVWRPRYNFSITVGNRGAHRVGAGVARKSRGAIASAFLLTAPPPAYAGSAAAAFLAGVSSAFRRISSAKRGIWPTPRTRSWR